MRIIIYLSLLVDVFPWSEDGRIKSTRLDGVSTNRFNITSGYNQAQNQTKIKLTRMAVESIKETSMAFFVRKPLQQEIEPRRWKGDLMTQSREPYDTFRPGPNFDDFLTGLSRLKNIPRVDYITADCFDNYMKINVRFNGTFNGLIYSTGYVHDPDCVFINGSGEKFYEFFIRLNRCGTLGERNEFNNRLPDDKRIPPGSMRNTVTIQYNPIIEEEWDEHFRVTCEYGYEFRKTITFPVVDVEVSPGNPVVFTLTPPQCYMEIRNGFNVKGQRIDGPVSVGEPLTLAIYMKTENTGFDILVSNCVAHNGGQKRLQLIDSNGCVTNDKLITPFRGQVNGNNGQDITLYAYLKAFRFTGSPALYLECDIHMCHGTCPPQRCYWKTLTRRSVDDFHAQPTTSPMFESINLFQALEVQQDDGSLYLRKRNNKDQENGGYVCLRVLGFAAIFAGLVFVLMLTTGLTMCLCIRLRRIKAVADERSVKMDHQFASYLEKTY
ncbi:uncharacterized protein LOC143257939 [Tachypleus tridentatus]|uniref:uncharacterized protein LOC143257939 n=1 Tax=Tachypleus tridentatus TaxID=6853 RepID=UPI003FD020CF